MKSPLQNPHAILDFYLDASAKEDIHRAIDSFHEVGGGFCDIGRYSDVRVSTPNARITTHILLRPPFC